MASQKRVNALLVAVGLVCFAVLAALPSVLSSSPPVCCGHRCDNCGGGCSCGSCESVHKDCDFYFKNYPDSVPTIHLQRKGDKDYVICGGIIHKDGYDSRPVKVVNSAHCEILMNGKWNKGACNHRLYGNGRHVASREFNTATCGCSPKDFLNRCIKIQISAAQYMDGGNFNNGHSNPRACVVVKTKNSFV